MAKFARQLVSYKVAGDFGLVDTAIVSTTFTKIGSYTVKSGEIVQVGGGYVYVLLKTSAPAEIPAKIRIFGINATESKKVLLYEFHTTATSDPADINKKLYIPPKMPRLGKDAKVQIEAQADTGATVDDANTIIQVPIIVEDVAV